MKVCQWGYHLKKSWLSSDFLLYDLESDFQLEFVLFMEYYCELEQRVTSYSSLLQLRSGKKWLSNSMVL